MKRNFLIFTVVVIGCVMFLQIGCQKQAKAPEEPKVAVATPKPVVGPEKAKTVPEAIGPAATVTFENVVHDFGEVGPMTKKAGEFKFTNTGEGLLKISRVDMCCGCNSKLSKKEYAPGESGTLRVECSLGARPGVIRRNVYVNSNDRVRPRVTLTIKGKIVQRVAYEPKRLNLLLKDENASCPELTLTSLDGKPFSIKQFSSTANCITADVDSSVEATKFVLQPKVDTEKLQRGLNGSIRVSLTHPECDMVTISFNALPRFKINPPRIILFKVEPQKPVNRNIWVLNNYGEDFEIESASSRSGIIKVQGQKKIRNGYQFMLEITPPAAEAKSKIFTDEFFVNIKGGKKLGITCRGFYLSKSGQPLVK